MITLPKAAGAHRGRWRRIVPPPLRRLVLQHRPPRRRPGTTTRAQRT